MLGWLAEVFQTRDSSVVESDLAGGSQYRTAARGPYYWTINGPYFCYNRAMKRISVQDLKARLSSAIAEAESGGTFLITRHSRAVALLTPAARHIHAPSSNQRPALKPALKRATKGRYLHVLLDDRAGGR